MQFVVSRDTHYIFFRKLSSCNSRHMQSKKHMFRDAAVSPQLHPATKKCPAQHCGINSTSPPRPTLVVGDGCWGNEWFSRGLGGHFTVSVKSFFLIFCRRNAFWGKSISISPRHQRLAVKQNFKRIGCGEKDRAGRTLKELQYQVIWDIFWVETLNCGGSYNPVILLQFSNRPGSEKLRCAAVVHAVESGVIPNFASS